MRRCDYDLKQLKVILDDRAFNRLEQHAAERTLQILIESTIGLAKHWAKKETTLNSTEARQAFNTLADKGVIKKSDTWRKVIGLLNVLVHDYLNVDTQIVQDIITKCYYKDILQFAYQAIAALTTE